MSYLSCPRIYFYGRFRMDAATGNNFQTVNFFGKQYEFASVANATVNTRFGDRELSDAEMRQFLEVDNLPNWNYWGSNEFSFPEAKVTGFDLGQGVRSQGDDLIGARVNFEKALMVSLNPAGLLSAQVISDRFVLGEDSMGLSGPPARAFSRWIWFARNPVVTAPPGVPGWVSASTVYQTAIPAQALSKQAGSSAALRQLLEALGGNGKGITVRYCLYATDIRKEANLTPAWGFVSGVIGIQSAGDLDTYPVARRLNPVKDLMPVAGGPPGLGPFGLGPAFAQVDHKRGKVVLDLITTIPEDSRVLEQRSKFDFGKLSLRLVEPLPKGQKGREAVVGSLSPQQYDRQAYEAASGIAEVPIAADVTPEMLENWDFRLVQDNPPGGDKPVAALAEEEFFAASDDDSIYLQQNQPASFPLHFFRKGKPTGKASWQVEQFVTTNVENPPPHPDPPKNWIVELPSQIESGPEAADVPLKPLQPGTCTFRFTPPGAETNGPLGRLTDSLVLARVLPEDNYDHITDEELKGTPGFQLIYREVFRYYYLLYPVMQQFVDFSNEAGMRASASFIKRVIDKKLLGKYAYMPRTRELSDGKRKLVERWIDLL